jgi:hypothetical protein
MLAPPIENSDKSSGQNHSEAASWLQPPRNEVFNLEFSQRAQLERSLGMHAALLGLDDILTDLLPVSHADVKAQSQKPVVTRPFSWVQTKFPLIQ